MTTWDDTLGSKVTQAAINFSTSGDNTIVSGVLNKTIRALQFFFVLAGATNLTYKSGSTALSGALNFPAAGAQVQDFIQLPLTCNLSDSFVINSSAAVQVGGTVWYIQ